jgi:ribosomal protein L11 methyltransferase
MQPSSPVENIPLMELSLEASDEAVDWVATLLTSTNYICDLCITKYSDTTHISNWTSTVWLYFPYDSYANTRCLEIENLLSSLQRTGLISELKAAVVEQKPQHKDASPPLIRRIGKHFTIFPTDISYPLPATDGIVLKLNPSFAFGSGLHPATILSLQLLERHLTPGMNVLDLGSGSGILSVAMAKLGANVLALDNDAVAVAATQDAVKLNEVESKVKVMLGSLGSGSEMGHWLGGNVEEDVTNVAPSGNFDLIIANIFARIHTTLTPEYQQALRPGGILIAAGFTDDYKDAIASSFQVSGFSIIDQETSDEWVALAAILNP